MNGWFTIEKIDTQTFAISEYQHYEETHCYLLCGQNKAALIDTGFGVSNIKSVVNHLTTLPVTVFTTSVGTNTLAALQSMRRKKTGLTVASHYRWKQ